MLVHRAPLCYPEISCVLPGPDALATSPLVGLLPLQRNGRYTSRCKSNTPTRGYARFITVTSSIPAGSDALRAPDLAERVDPIGGFLPVPDTAHEVPALGVDREADVLRVGHGCAAIDAEHALGEV